MLHTHSKDEQAHSLAQKHYQLEDNIVSIVRVRVGGTAEVEQQKNEPVKLLEVSETTIPSGIMPLQFGPEPGMGYDYPSIIIEVTPDEYEQIKTQTLSLPNGWVLGEEIKRDTEIPQ
ncbi:MAG: hypothetical protein KDA65_09505 [Planctomycetaceae bacterium]|nr:hypothetical protein [Planctomycetaceae bacterium]